MKKIFTASLCLVLSLTAFLACKKDGTGGTPVVPTTAIPTKIAINPQTTFQTITGFGGANRMWGTQSLKPPEATKAFGLNDGELGLSIFRVRISSNKNEWAIITEAVKEANKNGVKVLASPWSPPPALKDNNSDVRGILLPQNYKAFKDYINEFIAYQAQNGAKIDVVSIQNEPDWKPTYESCDWTADEMINFLKAPGQIVGAKLAAPESLNFNQNMTNAILSNDSAAAKIDIVAGHIYGGGLAKFPLAEQKKKEIWMTEYLMNLNSGNAGAAVWSTYSEAAIWNESLKMLGTIHDAMSNNWNAYIWWYLHRFYSFIGDGEQNTTNGSVLKRGFAFSHFSKYIRPGFVRIGVDVPSSSLLKITSYKKDAQTVIVVINLDFAAVKNVQFSGLTSKSVTSYTRADVPVVKRKEVYFRGNFFKFDKPVVKYRGFFINDEAPALSNWSKEKFGGFNAKFYEHVFELTLRLKGNYHWPAMWGNAFYDDDKKNGALADEYGIVMGTSHHEPLGRAHDEWRRYGKGGKWDYAKNDSSLRSFWREGVERVKNYDKLFSVGMRGDGDEPMSRETATALLEKIVADQRTIISDVTGKNAAQTPQLWALYKEVQDYYDKGMRVDDDITLLLCDDNWGNIRKLPKLDAPKRAGGYGIYYHFDYVGGPRNYKWLNTNNIARVQEQMNLAYRYGANQIWIVNVGDIKPMEFPLNFFMDYAWNPERLPAQSLRFYTERWTTQQFGARYAPQIAEILRGYANINARRKPELLSPETYSLANYREAESLVEEYRDLEKQAETIYADLASEYKDAFYQLVLFPVKACTNVNDLYVNTAKNRLYAQQGRVSTNDLAKRSEELYKKDAELTDAFHKNLVGGKWNNMMSQTHIGYTYWQQPKEQKMPEQKTITLLEKAEAGLSVEGLNAQNELPEINTAMPQNRYFDIFNKGTKPFDFTIKTNEKALKIAILKGTITTEQRIEVGVDADKLPKGKHRIPLSIETNSGQNFTVFVNVLKPELLDFYGFIEVDKTVSIEAEHFTNKVEKDNIRWQVLPDIGRKGSGVTSMPVTATKQIPSENAPHLDYKIWIAESGEATITAYLSPSLNFNESKSLQYAVSIDNEMPKIMDLTPDVSNKAWEKMVADNVAKIKSTHTFKTAGEHIFKYWLVDAGVVLQKITVTRGDEKLSYLGAPETRVFIQNPNEKGLKDYYKNYFPIGVAVSPQLFDDMQTAALVKTQFSSMTPENVMKMGPIHPEENRYNWSPADKIADFAQKNGILLRGHTLCWHNQTPTWFFKKDGKTVTKEELLARMKTHITDVVTRYKGKVYAWDVVNEAINDGGDKAMRESEFYKIIGEEFIERAFEYAHAADPNAKLFYNDYNTENAVKRERIYQLLKKLKAKGVPIHGVGLQGHWSNFEPSAAELEESITKFASLGLELHFTEVDMSVYPKRHDMSNEPFKGKAEFTPEMDNKQATQYKMLFDIFRKHKKEITSVTFWNLSDKYSWLDNFPVRGRKDFPLLFDVNHQPKKAYWEVVKF